MNRKEPVDPHQLDLAQNWDRWKDHIKQEYPDIKDEDLIYEIEKEEALLQRLGERTGKTRDQIYEWLHLMG